jgi:putative membrane protein
MTKKTLRHLIATGAAALTLAGPAAAQSVPGTPPARGGAPSPNAPRSTPAPAPQPPAATQPPASQPSGPAASAGTGSGANGQLSANQVGDRLVPMHARDMNFADLGKLGSERAANADVKKAASKMQSDFQKVDDQLKALAKERGWPLAANLSSADQGIHDQMLGSLQNLSGEQFDREFVKAASQGLEQYEQSAKQLRDTTSGKDARVKKWIDDVENVIEDNLNQVRTAKVALDKSRGQAKK